MCGCIDRVNSQLKDKNLELDTVSISGSEEKVIIPVKKIDRGSKNRVFIYTAVFCPFCGRIYEEGKLINV